MAIQHSNCATMGSEGGVETPRPREEGETPVELGGTGRGLMSDIKLEEASEEELAQRSGWDLWTF